MMNAEWLAVRYLTDLAKLERLLPPGFSLRGEPVVSVSCAWFKNLYWLAGGGCGVVAVDFPVSNRGKTETLDGLFCPVLWEGAPDAITTDRENLLFANIPEIEWNRWAGTASCETA
ncbi:acetoacetate decarboxylase family protein [Phenylobacterium montanum]|uniref:Acetoacetate decarboxylase family protein n=2 Tax=Phenylobacterium montanum TaxID=2823693 RepID=A0A975G351_9CAUL|nr:acetoacetate decarboxylase family protein [Caulobacter sp. S6]